MDAFSFALQFEKDGEVFYRNLAEKQTQSGIRNICLMLADAERAHYHIIEQLSRNADIELYETRLLSEVKSIFADMNTADVELSELSTLKMYETALDFEKKSMDFYLDLAQKENDDTRKEIFNVLGGEEKKHIFLLENLIEFVNRPQTWLENAEWNHLDEY